MGLPRRRARADSRHHPEPRSPATSPPPPTPSATAPTAAPSTTTTTPPRRTPPKSVPNSAFLQITDTNGDVPVENLDGEPVLPKLCDATFDSDDAIAVRRTRLITYWAEQRQDGQVPDGTFRQSITVYEPDQAARFLDELRAAVAGCPTQAERRYRLLSAPRHGDDSLVVEETYPTVDPDGKPTGGRDVRLVSVVRIGDVVTMLYEKGWEAGWSAEPDVVNAFTTKAVTRVESWLN
ncbi:hypothetical protein [Phytohabitans rumicis]|uniref:PknH-like extracellular domain-containing protein n=1 Tax=Phytohabitans rumicis TaxID=1076125 RepID=A0A6V8LFQ1_9ACTN|nr:hypothetical protein [Phytohabitans rumicis]GFJ93661.1 hypothetical protein Prum_073030 [Phytohabitans rumicis]